MTGIEYDCIATDEIVCPWCGCQYTDSFEFGGGDCNDGEEKCQDCGNLFSWDRDISVSYTTDRIAKAVEEPR